MIPVVKEKKQQADTANTILALAQIGVPSSKIRLVFNKVEIDESPEEEFAPLFGLAARDSNFVLNPDAIIYSNEVFEKLKSVGRSLGEITTDTTDYRAKLRRAATEEERELCIQMVALKRLAVTANKNLDDTYKALFA